MVQETFQRAPHDKENPYAQISRKLIRDSSLHPSTRWMLIYLLSYTGDWQIRTSHIKKLMKEHGIGRGMVYKFFNEAIEAGYMKREEFFVKGLKRIRYFVSDEPRFKKCLPCTATRDAAARDTAKPHNYEVCSSTKDEFNKEEGAPSAPPPPPSASNESSGGCPSSANAALGRAQPSKAASEIPKAALEASQKLFALIKHNNPKAIPPNYNSWAKDLDKLNRIDKQSWQDILEMIDWAQKHDFWSTNILSGAALRRNWNKLLAAKSKSDSKQPNAPRKETPQTEKNLITLQKLKERLPRHRQISCDGLSIHFFSPEREGWHTVGPRDIDFKEAIEYYLARLDINIGDLLE